ncbi:hypothetical protein I4U23_000092 [Adineta vaga]|nr:hypothetical protein I4U23_000092 [Adineta vaga]
MNYDDDRDWDKFRSEFTQALCMTLNVPESEVHIHGIVRGSIIVILLATIVIIIALVAIDIDPRPKVILISTVAGAGMGAAIGTVGGPVGTIR